MSFRSEAAWEELARSRLNVDNDGKVDFYRVENKEKQGPYRAPSVRGRLADLDAISKESFASRSDRHPMPMFEPRKGQVYGFTSLDQMRRWFTQEELDVLRKHGFEAVKYRVSARTLRFDRAQASTFRAQIAYQVREPVGGDQPRHPAGSPEGGRFAPKE